MHVVVVCLGNICRSPMAEAILRHRLAERGLDGSVTVDSAGTGGWHEGETADPRTLAVLARHGLPEPSRARRVRPEDFHDADWLLAMDRSNLDTLASRAPAEATARRALFLEPTTGGEVPDPYYGGSDGFDRVFALVDAAAAAWVDRLAAQLATGDQGAGGSQPT